MVINRNRLLFGNKIEYLTLPLVKGSDGLNIRDRLISEDWSSVSQKYKRKIALHYSNRKNFDQGMAFFEEISAFSDLNLFEFLKFTILKITKLFNLKAEIITSSDLGDFSQEKGVDRVLEICKVLNAKRYVNAIGGQNLYNVEDFGVRGIDLIFVKSVFTPYDQSIKQFTAGLSVLDMIFSLSDPEEINQQIRNYDLI